MRPFDYQAPTTVDQAVALLDDASARALAGGTDLLIRMRYGQAAPPCLVDVKRIPELTRIELGEAGLTFGAAVSCVQLCEHPGVKREYPGLVDAVSIIGGAAIQNRATVGGNLCNAAPSADSIPALIVLGASCTVAGPQGRREVPVDAFCTAPGQTVLAAGELLVSIHVPPPAPRSGAAYQRFIPRREMDIAVAGAGAWLALDAEGTIAAARLALSAVAPVPLPVPQAAQALVGQAAAEDAFAAAARLAQEAARPIDDVRGSAAQRRHLIGVLVRRALRSALERARQSPF